LTLAVSRQRMLTAFSMEITSMTSSQPVENNRPANAQNARKRGMVP
jgi:hypothetical protein